jgi:hypothetical protein
MQAQAWLLFSAIQASVCIVFLMHVGHVTYDHAFSALFFFLPSSLFSVSSPFL